MYVILYEDPHLTVLDKPAGVPVEPPRSGGENVIGQTGLLACHRLDADTSGVLVLAKSALGQRAVNAAFAERRVEKTYLAVVQGAPPEAFVVDVPLGEWKRGRVVIGRGRDARTTFERRWLQDRRAGVVCRPETGRTHQIRAHLCHARTPIVGDPDYGGPAADRLYLHASRLVLPWPHAGDRLVLTSPTPAGFDA